MLFGDQASVVASPVTASPPRTLVKELDVVFKRRLNLALLLVLDPSLPLIRNQPSRDKIIIIGIKLELAPSFGLESIKEQGTLQNLRAKRTSTSRHARSPTINAMCSRNFEISSLNISSPEPVEDIFRNRSRFEALDSLARSDAAHFRVFEWSKKPGKNGARPRDIIICHDYERCVDFWNSLTDLNTLVGDGNMEYADVRHLQCFDE